MRLAIESHQFLVAAPVASYRLAGALCAATQRSQRICLAGVTARKPGDCQYECSLICCRCLLVECIPDQHLPILASQVEQGWDQTLGKGEVGFAAIQGFILGV